MVSLQYFIDHMCANFTAELMRKLVKAQIAKGPCTSHDITQAIIERDRSLDITSAQTLVDAAVAELAQSGDVVLRDAHLYLAG